MSDVNKGWLQTFSVNLTENEIIEIIMALTDRIDFYATKNPDTYADLIKTLEVLRARLKWVRKRPESDL